jgi:hypothetical protein
MGERLTLPASPDRVAEPVRREAASPTLGRGDRAFLDHCEQHLNHELTGMGRKLLAAVRDRYRGELHEGLARKWVNHPGNFFALTIQPRDQSFAVHVKGEPHQFAAPTLDIRPDRGSYSRFKLKSPRGFDHALRVVLTSARMNQGY